MKKRVLAWALALVLTLGLFPIGTLAAGEMVTIQVSGQRGFEYFYPQTELVVEAGMAQRYGYQNSSSVAEGTVTALDALVAAHKQHYGDAFTKETATTYLTMKGPSPEMMFQTAATGLFSGFSINHEYPMDSRGTGYTADNAPLSDGDVVDFFYYSTSYKDYTAWFTNAAGTKIDTLVAGVDVPITVGLAGYEFMTGYAKPTPEALYHETEGALAVYQISEDGTIGDLVENITSDKGVALTFTELGTQKLVAMGMEGKADSPLIMPILTVDVQAEAPEEVIPPTGVVVTENAVTLPLDQTHQIQASVVPANAKQDVIYEVLFGNVTVSETGLVEPTNSAAAGAKAIIQVKCKEKDTLSINVTVTFQAPPSSAEVLADLLTKLPTSWTPEEWNGASTAKQDTNLIAMVQAAVTKLHPSVTVNAVCVPGEGQTQIAADGTITYGASRIKNKPVTFMLELGQAELAYTADVTVDKKTATKEDALKGDWLTFATIQGTNAGADAIKNTLSLPKEDSEGYSTEVEWTSSNPAVLEISDYTTNSKFTGKVTRPVVGQQDAQVILSAKIKPGIYWDYGMAPAGPMPDPAYTIKTFTLTVPAVTQEEQNAAQSLVDAGITLYTLGGVTARDTKQLADLMALTYHINDIPYNWNYVNKLPGFSADYRVIDVTWSSTNPGISEVSSGATITRTAADQTGDIVLTLSYNGATASKAFPTKVLAFTPEDATKENANLQAVKDALSFDIIRKDNWLTHELTGSLLRVQAAVLANGTATFATSTKFHHEGANIAWASSNTAVISNTLAVTRPAVNTEVTLTATLTSPKFANCPGVNLSTKEFRVTVLGRESNPVLDTVAARYTGNLPSWWMATAMSAYERYQPNTAHKVTAEAKQAFVNSIVADVAANSTKSGNLANAILSLSALGYDPTDITAADGTKYNAVTLLKAVDIEVEKANTWSFFTVPGYVLLACNQGDYDTQALETAVIDFLLEKDDEAGGWSTAWGVDSTGMTMQGLAPYYSTNEQVKDALDKAVTVLSQKQNNNGTFGTVESTNPSSDAMAILGLGAMGINPATDNRFIKEGKSALDGLMSHYSDGSFGDAYYESQGLAAAVAMAELQGGKTDYNIFDFGQGERVPTVATPDQGGGGDDTDPPTGDTMNVSFTLKTHNATWIPKHTVSVAKGATVGAAIKKVLDAKAAFTYVDSSGYISSITHNGTTLAEFGQGPNSGWKYMVNGVAYGVGMNSKTLTAGDDLVWYYVTDYTTDTDRDEGSFNKPQTTTPELTGKGEDATVEVKPTITADKKGQAIAQITEKEMNSALATAKKGEAKTVVLVPQVKGAATAVTVELPTASAAAIAKEGLTLRVKTGLADLTLNAAALATLGGQTGKTVSVTAKMGEKDTIRLDVRVGDTVAHAVTGGMKISLPAEKAGPGTVLVLVDDQGNETVVKLSAVVNGQLNALLAGSATVKLVDNATDFSDLEPGHWAANAAAFATSRELLKGTGEGMFAPAVSMTRASLMTILCRLDGGEAEQAAEGEEWYAPGQRWAMEQGLSDGSNPEGEMTRQELVALLYRYAKAEGAQEDIQAPDAADIAPWAAEAMSWAVKVGLLTGDQDGQLRPNGKASRAEVAVMLERFIRQMVV